MQQFFFKNSLTFHEAFFIGTIDEVNKKISKLDRKLQKYTALVVESRASNYEDTDDTVSVSSAKGRDRYEKRGLMLVKNIFIEELDVICLNTFYFIFFAY